jgi:TP901 family phage tail tape measure protein
VKIVLRGDITQFVTAMKQAGASAQAALGNTLKGYEKHRASIDDLGRSAGRVGLVAAAGMGLAAKAAIDWDTAWAGVTKTVNGTASEMGLLEDELRELARTLPATHTEIAGVAEAAGQLGIAREDITSFTETMIALGETTNITAEDAATSIARLANVMGTSADNIERIGSTLVDLGNNSATTEAEILEMGQRLSAAGAIAGLAESDVLGFAAALTSVGVEAEAGGTAMSKVFTSVRDAALDGGEALDTFAGVAGVSAAEFQAAFNEDAAGAVEMFIAGLGKMNAAGESTTSVFKTLKLTDQRLMRALLSTAEAGDLLTDSLDLGGEAWAENTALADEAAQRYETTASKMTVALNNIKDSAIEVGEVVLPMLEKAAGGVSTLAQAFGKLPAPVQTAAVALGGITAVTGGGLWFGTKVLGGITDTRRALGDLGMTADGLSGRFKTMGKATADTARGVGAAFDEMSGKQVALRGGAAIFGMMAMSLNDLDDSADRATRTMGGFINVASAAMMGFAVAGPLGAAIGGGISIIGELVGVLKEGEEASRAAAEGAKAYAATLDEVTGAATDATEALVAKRLEEQGALEAAGRLGINTDELVAGILDSTGEAADRVRDKLASLRAEYTGTTGEAQTMADAIDGANGGLWDQVGNVSRATSANGDLVPVLNEVSDIFGVEAKAINEAAASTERQAEAAGLVADVAPDAADGLSDIATAAGEATEEVDGFAKAMDEAHAVMEGRDAQRGYEQSLDDFREALKERKDLQKELAEAEQDLLTADTDSERDSAKDKIADLKEELKDYALTLDRTKEAGRDWEERLEDIATRALEAGVTMTEADQKPYMRKARQDFIELATKITGSRREARKLAGDLGLLDDYDVEPEIKVDVGAALRGLELIDDYQLDDKTFKVTGLLSIPGFQSKLKGDEYASGGYTGNGGKYEPAGIVHGGEYVINAEQTARHFNLLERINKGYASGGFVAASRPAPSQSFDPATFAQQAAGGGAPSVVIQGGVQPHNYNQFLREMEDRQRLAATGGADFR